MAKWVKLFDTDDKVAMDYFASLPKWAKERYYQKHPENRVKFETGSKMSSKLTQYFAADKAGQAAYLKANPDLVKWLAANADDSFSQQMSVMQAYRSIPKEDAWLRRVFREKYPEIFSAEAIGEKKLKGVWDQLAKHPEMTDEFEKWVEQVWGTYAEMLKHAPRPVKTFMHADRKVPERKQHQSRSAEWTSAH
jgi:hypothetical protein